MSIVIFNSEKEGSMTLTKNDAGRVVLRISGAPKVKDGDYGPSDLIGDPEYPYQPAGIVSEATTA
jgi:hypothetical protein